MIPDWLPTRYELRLRAIKWIWRGSRVLEEWSRRHMRTSARRAPRSDREWRRVARLARRMEPSDDEGAS